MRLAPVLAESDLDPVELQAARLDGEVYGLAGAYCLVGELESPAHRARAVLAGRSPRLIAERGSAAWVWGALDELSRVEFAVAPDARARLPRALQIEVREIVYRREDVTTLDGCRVTTPLRTILDIARCADRFPADTITRLAAIGGLTRDDCLTSLEARRGFPARAHVATLLARSFTR